MMIMTENDVLNKMASMDFTCHVEHVSDTQLNTQTASPSKTHLLRGIFQHGCDNVLLER